MQKVTYYNDCRVDANGHGQGTYCAGRVYSRISVTKHSGGTQTNSCDCYSQGKLQTIVYPKYISIRNLEPKYLGNDNLTFVSTSNSFWQKFYLIPSTWPGFKYKCMCAQLFQICTCNSMNSIKQLRLQTCIPSVRGGNIYITVVSKHKLHVNYTRKQHRHPQVELTHKKFYTTSHSNLNVEDKRRK